MDFERPLVLVADHDDDLRQTCAEYLRAHGLRVEEAADGRQALAKAAALAPDVVVFDVALPGMESAGAIRLAGSSGPRRTEVIAMSGSDSEETRRKAKQASCCEFLVKRRLPERLLGAVHKAVARSRRVPSSSRIRVRPTTT